MPNDVITIKALTSELSSLLSGGKVEKIYQPESDEITFSVKNQGKNHLFVISANPSHPRAHITTQKKENSLTAPAFCMLMRKYLIGAIFDNLEVFNNDRIIKITIDGRSELKDKVQYYLFIELMGRYSNIILTKTDLTIIDAIKRIHLDQSTSRYILPNLTYPMQPKNKASLDDLEALTTIFSNADKEDSGYLMSNISGISKETAKEIAFSDNPYDKLQEFINIFNKDTYKPCLLYKNGKLSDFFITPYQTMVGQYEFFPTLNEAVDKFYSQFDGNERKKANTKNLNALLKRLQNKVARRINDNNEKLIETEKMEAIKQTGDLILAYIYLIKPKSTELECFDYYNNCQITIPLDKTLSPSQNAQIHYKRYNKLKRTEEIATNQLVSLFEQQEYLKSIATAIENSSQKQEYQEILDELNALNGFKKPINKKKTKVKPSSPMHIIYKECDIYWGKNNVQNNEVTFKIANNGDMWFHTKANHGTHLIVKGEIDEDTILKAAQIAAYYSEVRTAERVEVDYCLKKYVKKIPSAMLGMVTYSQYKSIIVSPKDESI